MAEISQTFTSSTSWTLAHPWGNVQPYVVATRNDSRPLEVGPEYTNGQVVVTFKVATAGTLTLHGPDTGGGGALAEITTPAQIVPAPRGRIA